MGNMEQRRQKEEHAVPTAGGSAAGSAAGEKARGFWRQDDEKI